MIVLSLDSLPSPSLPLTQSYRLRLQMKIITLQLHAEAALSACLLEGAGRNYL